MSNDLHAFIQDLGEIGLLTLSEACQLLELLPPADRPSDGEGLGRILVAEQVLTEFQATEIHAGRANELVLGNYLVLAKLGQGGMGTVFKAQHRRMKRVVAIKLLSRQLVKSPILMQRFQREVEAVARLSHPNVVTAYDADESPLGPFLVMEYVDGCDLAAIVKRTGPLPLRDAVDCIVQAARGLECAHNHGIIHRDVKPANLLRDAAGTIKVTDLGLARIEDEAAAGALGLTQDGSVFGTVDFIAPEQAMNSRNADLRADIYSLGCTFYYLLTGRMAFSGETILERLLAHREKAIPALSELRPDVPPALDAVYQKMVAKKPEDRQQTMGEVIKNLEACDCSQADLPTFLGLPTEGVADVAPTSNQFGGSLTLVDLSVLLVEPSRAQTRVITGQLQRMGIRRVQTAAGGAQAIELMRATRPDMVLSSMHLVDMTAAELVQRMRSDDEIGHIAFLLITGDSDARLVEPVRQAGAVAILQKPFNYEKLEQAVRAGLDFLSGQGQPLACSHLDQLRVLIVDDSSAARHHIRRVLYSLGLRHTTQAVNGAQAVSLLENNHFDLVVTDYHMPEMNGQELLTYIRQRSAAKSMPVLMVTSEGDPDRLNSVRKLGVSGLCHKTFEPNVVRSILDKVLPAAAAVRKA